MFFPNCKKAVFVGAHTDDEMIVAGTLRKLVKLGIEVNLLVVSYAPIPGLNKAETIAVVRPEFLNAMEHIGIAGKNVHVIGLDPRTMPDHQNEIRQTVYDFVEREKPDLAFILSNQDDHQDHAILGKICEAVMKNRVPAVIRCHYPWDFINPGRRNLFVRLSVDEFEAKLSVIRAYKSQHFRYDYENLFTAIVQANGLATKNKLAEAFEIAYLISGQEEE